MDQERTAGDGRHRLPIIGALVFAVVAGLVLFGRSDPQPDAPSATLPLPDLVVLPLIDLTGSGGAIDDALTSEIAAALATLPGAVVRGRHTAAAGADVNREAAVIAAEIGASAVVDGTIRRTGGRLRVAARLLDVRTGSVLWTGARDTAEAEWHAARDGLVLEMAEALALEVDESLRLRLRTRRASWRAFTLYAQGRFGWAEGAGGDLLQAVDFYLRSVEADSTFAPSWTALAAAYAALPRFTRFPVETVRIDGAAAARRALRLDPDDADAHRALGEILFLYERDHGAARTHLTRASELDPGSAAAHAGLCELELYYGRLEEAAAACLQATSMDPAAFQPAWLRTAIDRVEGDFERSARGLEDLLGPFPDYPPLVADLLFTRMLAGDTAGSDNALLYWVELLGGEDALADALSTGDRPAALARLADRLDPAPGELAGLAALLGEVEVATTAAQRAAELRDPTSLRFARFPAYGAIRSRAEFQRLLEELGLPALSP